jgi:hypothetical protein
MWRGSNADFDLFSRAKCLAALHLHGTFRYRFQVPWVVPKLSLIMACSRRFQPITAQGDRCSARSHRLYEDARTSSVLLRVLPACL